MGADGSGETQLTQSIDHDEVDPGWSPDGQRIVFASNEGLDSRGQNNFDIWMMTADGSNRMQLTTNGSRDDQPAFGMGGTFIYFRSNRGGFWNIWRFAPVLE